MRVVTINGQPVNIVGSVFTQWIYEDHFGQSMLADFERIDPKVARYYDALPKMCWAMARNAVYPTPFPDYKTWLVEVQWDTSTEGLAQAVIFEATRALFPSRAAMVSELEKRYKAEHPAGASPGAGLSGDG